MVDVIKISLKNIAIFGNIKTLAKMYKTSKSIKIRFSDVQGETPALSEVSDNTLCFNLMDNALYGEDRSAKPSVVKQLNASVSLTYQYTAFLSQSGTDAPEATVLINTFPQSSGVREFYWTRESAGTYRFHSTSALFTAGKSIPSAEIYTDEGSDVYTVTWISTTVFELKSFDGTDLVTPVDDKLSNRYFNIEIVK